MARTKNKNETVEEEEIEEEEEEDEDDEEEEEEEAPPPKKKKAPGKLTKEQKRALFADYQQAVDDVNEVKLQLAEAENLVRDKVVAIRDACGTGPFGWNGATLRIVSRKTGAVYMRTIEHEAENID